MKPNFLNFISAFTATAVAGSQKDLLVDSRNNMLICLSFVDEGQKQKAFETLDTLSQYIVYEILSADDLDSAEINLEYAIKQLKSALGAIRKTNDY